MFENPFCILMPRCNRKRRILLPATRKRDLTANCTPKLGIYLENFQNEMIVGIPSHQQSLFGVPSGEKDTAGTAPKDPLKLRHLESTGRLTDTANMAALLSPRLTVSVRLPPVYDFTSHRSGLEEGPAVIYLDNPFLAKLKEDGTPKCEHRADSPMSQTFPAVRLKKGSQIAKFYLVLARDSYGQEQVQMWKEYAIQAAAPTGTTATTASSSTSSSIYSKDIETSYNLFDRETIKRCWQSEKALLERIKGQKPQSIIDIYDMKEREKANGKVKFTIAMPYAHGGNLKDWLNAAVSTAVAKAGLPMQSTSGGATAYTTAHKTHTTQTKSHTTPAIGLTERAALAIMKQILLALAFLHRGGHTDGPVYHRDLCLANCLVMEHTPGVSTPEPADAKAYEALMASAKAGQGAAPNVRPVEVELVWEGTRAAVSIPTIHVKVCDFNASAAHEKALTGEPTERRMTLAPEFRRLVGETNDAYKERCEPHKGGKADVWSAGIIFLQLLGYRDVERFSEEILPTKGKNDTSLRFPYSMPYSGTAEVESLLCGMLDPNAAERLDAVTALSHPAFSALTSASPIACQPSFFDQYSFEPRDELHRMQNYFPFPNPTVPVAESWTQRLSTQSTPSLPSHQFCEVYKIKRLCDVLADCAKGTDTDGRAASASSGHGTFWLRMYPILDTSTMAQYLQRQSLAAMAVKGAWLNDVRLRGKRACTGRSSNYRHQKTEEYAALRYGIEDEAVFDEQLSDNSCGDTAFVSNAAGNLPYQLEQLTRQWVGATDENPIYTNPDCRLEQDLVQAIVRHLLQLVQMLSFADLPVDGWLTRGHGGIMPASLQLAAPGGALPIRVRRFDRETDSPAFRKCVHTDTFSPLQDFMIELHTGGAPTHKAITIKTFDFGYYYIYSALYSSSHGSDWRKRTSFAYMSPERYLSVFGSEDFLSRFPPATFPAWKPSMYYLVERLFGPHLSFTILYMHPADQTDIRLINDVENRIEFWAMGLQRLLQFWGYALRRGSVAHQRQAMVEFKKGVDAMKQCLQPTELSEVVRYAVPRFSGFTVLAAIATTLCWEALLLVSGFTHEADLFNLIFYEGQYWTLMDLFTEASLYYTRRTEVSLTTRIPDFITALTLKCPSAGWAYHFLRERGSDTRRLIECLNMPTQNVCTVKKIGGIEIPVHLTINSFSSAFDRWVRVQCIALLEKRIDDVDCIDAVLRSFGGVSPAPHVQEAFAIRVRDNCKRLLATKTMCEFFPEYPMDTATIVGGEDVHRSNDQSASSSSDVAHTSVPGREALGEGPTSWPASSDRRHPLDMKETCAVVSKLLSSVTINDDIFAVGMTMAALLLGRTAVETADAPFAAAVKSGRFHDDPRAYFPTSLLSDSGLELLVRLLAPATEQIYQQVPHHDYFLISLRRPQSHDLRSLLDLHPWLQMPCAKVLLAVDDNAILWNAVDKEFSRIESVYVLKKRIRRLLDGNTDNPSIRISLGDIAGIEHIVCSLTTRGVWLVAKLRELGYRGFIHALLQPRTTAVRDDLCMSFMSMGVTDFVDCEKSNLLVDNIKKTIAEANDDHVRVWESYVQAMPPALPLVSPISVRGTATPPGSPVELAGDTLGNGWIDVAEARASQNTAMEAPEEHAP